MYSAKLLSNNGVASIYHNGQTFSFDNSHPKYNDLLKLLDQDKYEELVKELSSLEKKVEKRFSKTGVEVRDGAVYFNGEVLHGAVVDRIIEFTQSGRDPSNLVNFLELLQKNTDYQAKQNLYTFLEKNQMPINKDGRVVAYKRVRDDFKDFYSGKFDNSVGSVVEMERGKVDNDNRNECSYGLHVANLPYARDHYHSGSGRLVVVLVDPADFIAVPKDYDFMKARVCKYEVIDELKDHYKPLTQDDLGGRMGDYDDDDYDDEYDDEEYDDDNYEDEYDDEEDEEYDDRTTLRPSYARY